MFTGDRLIPLVPISRCYNRVIKQTLALILIMGLLLLQITVPTPLASAEKGLGRPMLSVAESHPDALRSDSSVWEWLDIFEEQTDHTSLLESQISLEKEKVLGNNYQQIWVFETETEPTCVSVSSEVSYIALGCTDGIYFLDNHRNLLWNLPTDYPIIDISMSGDASQVVAGGSKGYYFGGRTYFLSKHGELVSSFDSVVSSVSLSRDGNYFAQTYAHSLGWNDLVALWGYNEGEWLWYKTVGACESGSVSISLEGNYLAVGTSMAPYGDSGSGVRFYDRGGNPLWGVSLDTNIGGVGKFSVSISSDGKYIAAGARYLQGLYLFERDEKLIGSYDIGNIRGVALSGDGTRIAVVTSDTLYVFDNHLNLLWSTEINNLKNVAISADGSSIITVSSDKKVRAFASDLIPSQAGRVKLIEPLDITHEPHIVGDTLTATFRIRNDGDAPIKLDKLLLGGRFNGGELPGGGYPDFTERTVTLQPEDTYPYEGTYTLTEAGEYEFFIAYYIKNPTEAEREFLDENNWNTCIELSPGLTDANRTRTITAEQVESQCWAENLAVINTNKPIPEFRWTYKDSGGRSMRQYQVRVYQDFSIMSKLIWDSGEIWHPLSNNAQINVEYKGRRLETNRNYFFTVRVHNGQGWSLWHEHNFALTAPVIYDPYEGVSWGGRMLVQLHAHYKDDAKEFLGIPIPFNTYGQDFYDSVRDKYKTEWYTNVFFSEHSGSNWQTWLPPDHLQRSKAVECTGEKTHLLALGITELVTPFGKPPHLYSQEKWITERVEQVVSQTWTRGTGALAIPAHPNSSHYPWPKIFLDQAIGAQAMEIYTGALKYIPGLSNQALATCKWDAMLRENKIIWGVATDDYTPGRILGQFGPDLGAVAIPYPGGSYCYFDWKVLDIIRRGAFYATTGNSGPELAIHVEGGTIHVTAPSWSTVYFISQEGIRYLADLYFGTTASYDISPNDKYIRIEVVENKAFGKLYENVSWSQPIFLQPTGSSKATIYAGEEGGLSLHHFILNVDAGEEIVEFNLSLPEDRSPAILPPGGVVGYPYYLEINGSPNGSARLTISYAHEVVIPYLVPSLSIYHLPPGGAQWAKLDTELNRELKELRAGVLEEGWYAISTDRSGILTPMGIVEPAIEIIQPEQDNEIYNTPFTFAAEIIDDTGIWKMDYFLGDIWLGYDIWPDDGWSVEVDPSLYSEGEHTLTVVAEDLDGRTAQAQRSVILTGGVAPPAISITAPSPGSTIGAAALVEGTFSTEPGLQSIMVGIADIPLGEAEINDSTWSCPIPGGFLPAGNYALWAEVRDIYGNSSRDEVTVQLGSVLQLSPPTGLLLTDRPFQIWLMAGGLENNLGAAETVLSFDPSQLEITNVLEGSRLVAEGGETEFSYFIDTVEGLLEITIRQLSGDPNPDQGGHLATIEMTPRHVSGTAELNFVSSTLLTFDEENITHITAGAEFTLNSPPVFVNLPASVNLSIDKPFTFQVEATHPGGHEISFNLVGDDPVFLGAMTIDPATGNLSWPEPATGIYELTVQAKDHHHTLTESALQLIAVKYGSVTGDGKVDVGDAIMVLRSIVGLTNLDLLQKTAADVNGDGKIDVSDAILILRRIVGLIDRFPVEE